LALNSAYISLPSLYGKPDLKQKSSRNVEVLFKKVSAGINPPFHQFSHDLHKRASRVQRCDNVDHTVQQTQLNSSIITVPKQDHTRSRSKI